MFDTLFWALYWIDILASLPMALLVGTILALVCCIPIWAEDLPRRFFTIPAIIFMFCMIAAFVPSKSTMYMMLAVKGGEHVVNSETGKKLQKLLDQQLDSALEVLEKKAKKE